jgi:hypothetical protein
MPLKRVRRTQNAPLPFNVGDGKFPGLNAPKVREPAMMQVIEEDTHDNYVICRGFDPEYNRFFEWIPVAKPYGERGQTGLYNVGEVHLAIKPKTRLGLTPGVSETSTGHPEDLDEEIAALYTDNDIAISFMFVRGGGGNIKRAKLNAALSGGSAEASVWGPDGDTDEDVTVNAWMINSGETIESGTEIVIGNFGGEWYIVAAACPEDD